MAPPLPVAALCGRLGQGRGHGATERQLKMLSNGNSFGTGKTTEREANWVRRWLSQTQEKASE